MGEARARERQAERSGDLQEWNEVGCDPQPWTQHEHEVEQFEYGYGLYFPARDVSAFASKEVEERAGKEEATEAGRTS